MLLIYRKSKDRNLRQNNATSRLRMAHMRQLPVVQLVEWIAGNVPRISYC
jgi:hypothetical protein